MVVKLKSSPTPVILLARYEVDLLKKMARNVHSWSIKQQSVKKQLEILKGALFLCVEYAMCFCL